MNLLFFGHHTSSWTQSHFVIRIGRLLFSFSWIPFIFLIRYCLQVAVLFTGPNQHFSQRFWICYAPLKPQPLIIRQRNYKLFIYSYITSYPVLARGFRSKRKSSRRGAFSLIPTLPTIWCSSTYLSGDLVQGLILGIAARIAAPATQRSGTVHVWVCMRVCVWVCVSAGMWCAVCVCLLC